MAAPLRAGASRRFTSALQASVLGRSTKVCSGQTRTIVQLRGAGSPSRTATKRPISFTPSPSLLAIRSLSGRPLPQKKSWILNFCYRGAAWLGISATFIGLGIVGFFLYDASTYKEAALNTDLDISQLALQPRRGGPKNLPIIDVFLDDNDSEAKKRSHGKPRLVILGGGWGGVALLKELNPDDYHVTLVSPTNYFLFTPMLPSATVDSRISIPRRAHPPRVVPRQWPLCSCKG